MCLVETRIVYGVLVDTDELWHKAQQYLKQRPAIRTWSKVTKLKSAGKLRCLGNGTVTVADLPVEVLAIVDTFLWQSISNPELSRTSPRDCIVYGCHHSLDAFEANNDSDAVNDAVEREEIHELLTDRSLHTSFECRFPAECTEEWCKVSRLLFRLELRSSRLPPTDGCPFCVRGNKSTSRS